MGIGLAFFLEYLDSSIRTLDDVQNLLRVFPLGMVPQVELIVKGPVESKDEKAPRRLSRIFWNTSDESVPIHVTEAYRIIRTNLAFGSVDETSKVFQVTSAVKGEGKTTTTANLGISMAQAGNKVLVIDADMRRPALHHVFRLEGVRHGLNDLIADGRSLESLVEPTGIPNLFCLPAGRIPPNPSELLSSKRMKELIEECKMLFDVVFLDSPPVISVADSPIIASRVDGTILVARSGYLPRDLCLQAKKSIEAVHGRIIGCVLNSVLREHHSYYYHRYYDYGDYYYYGDDKEKSSKRKKGRKTKMTIWDRLGLFKEPMLAFLSSGWDRFTGATQEGDRTKKSQSL